MTTPRTEHTRPDRKAPLELEDLPLFDDGTMSMAPLAPEVDLDARPVAPPRGWWVAASSIAVALGLVLATVLTPGTPTRVPSALAVLAAQGTAMESQDPAHRARALELGQAYLERGPDGPYQDLIRSGQDELRCADHP